MSAKQPLCQATTKAGTACKNHAQSESSYCYIHRSLEEAAISPEATPSAVTAAAAALGSGKSVPASRARFEVLANELNALAAELQRSVPAYRAPAFSADGLVALLKRNLDRFTPDIQIEIVTELRQNLAGTTPRDLVDPDTWKGLWYILNYLAQEQSTAMREKLYARLSMLPGMALLSDIKGNLEGTSPKELLDLDTWRGMWLIMSYSVQATAKDVKRALVGDEEES